MVVIQECFGTYTQDWSCFKENTQQIIAEVKTNESMKKFKFTVNQTYCTIYVLFYVK